MNPSLVAGPQNQTENEAHNRVKERTASGNCNRPDVKIVVMRNTLEVWSAFLSPRNFVCNSPEVAHRMFVMICDAALLVLAVMFEITWLMVTKWWWSRLQISSQRTKTEIGDGAVLRSCGSLMFGVELAAS